ncbi:MAG: hypothetical protein ACM3WU_04430 [Bacillota bacterium]
MLDDTRLGFGRGVAFSKGGSELNGWGIPLTATEKITGDWYYFEIR